MRLAKALFILAICVLVPESWAQNMTQGARPRSHTSTEAHASSPEARELEQRIESLSIELQKRDVQLQKLELKISQKPAHDQTITTGVIAAGAVIAAALIGMFGQFRTTKWQERVAIRTADNNVRLAREGAIYKNFEKIFDYRLTQLQEFYAPMSALQKQSRSLYDKLLTQLPEQEPERYRTPPAEASHNFRMEVRVGEKWEKFYLLDQLPAIRSNPSAYALVGEIVQIGSQMTAIISKKAGLAKPEILEVLGAYMGHYAILSTLYRDSEIMPFAPGWHKMGYYPYQKFDEGIESGYKDLVEFLTKHAAASQELVEQASAKKS